jgi:hypothetical protein
MAAMEAEKRNWLVGLKCVESRRNTFLEGIRTVADNSEARYADRLRAYELMGKHLRLFTEKVEQDSHLTVIVERIG